MPAGSIPGAPVVPAGVVVLDTNVVLDLLVFDDPAVRLLMQALRQQRVRWLASADMRAELARVLAYPKIAARLAAPGRAAPEVLSGMDRWCQAVAAPAPASIRCSDPDDQVFIDLAVAHRAVLLSKDDAVLRLHRQLQRCGAAALAVKTWAAWAAPWREA